MSTLKTLFKYVLMIIGFFIFTEFLIQVGLNINYKPIKRLDNNSEVSIYQAEATLVNGRIKGVITNTNGQDLANKYLRVDLYSERDVLLGRKYVELENLTKDDSQAFEVLFKAEDVNSYNVEITDHKEPETEFKITFKNWMKPEILVAKVILLCMVF